MDIRKGQCSIIIWHKWQPNMFMYTGEFSHPVQVHGLPLMKIPVLSYHQSRLVEGRLILLTCMLS